MYRKYLSGLLTGSLIVTMCAGQAAFAAESEPADESQMEAAETQSGELTGADSQAESDTALAATTSEERTAIEAALDLANNTDQEWTYSSDSDSWTLSIVSAVVNPEIPDEQGVSVCVPGAYVKGIDTDGDGNADVTAQTAEGAVSGSLVIDYETSVTSTNGQIYTAATAPVIINTGAAGYSEQQNQTASSMYAAEGYINVACGNRGKQSTVTDEDGTTEYTGDAPSCLVDQKNAVRFVKYNILLGNLPGSVDYFISTGGSGGGAHATMLAATSNNPDFYDYEIEAGAVGVYRNEDGSYSTTVTIDGTDYELSDGMWGCIAYSAITSLAEADMAMAFEYYMDTDYTFNTDFQAQLAEYLSAEYMEYINAKNLSVEEAAVGFDLNADGDKEDTIALAIEYDPETHGDTNGYYGTYLDLYLAQFQASLQDYLDNLDYAEGWTWFDENGTALSDEAVAAMTLEDKQAAFLEGRYTKSSSGGKGGFGGPGGMGGFGGNGGPGEKGGFGGNGGSRGMNGENRGNQDNGGPDGMQGGFPDGAPEGMSEPGQAPEDLSEMGAAPEGMSEPGQLPEDISEMDGTPEGMSETGQLPEDMSEMGAASEGMSESGQLPEDISELGAATEGMSETGQLPEDMSEMGAAPENMSAADSEQEEVGTPDAGTTQSASSSVNSNNYSSYEEMLAAYQEDIAEVEAGDQYGNNVVQLYNPLNYIGADDTENPVWSRILMGASEGDMSMFSSLNLQLAWLNAGTDAVIEWQWDGGHVPSEILGDSFALYVDEMYGKYVDGAVQVTKPEAEALTENGTSESASGTDLTGWVNSEDLSDVSFTLADAVSYRTKGASKAIPGFDVIDYGQEDYVFGSSEKDARHWNRYLLNVLEENAEVLSGLF